MIQTELRKFLENKRKKGKDAPMCEQLLGTNTAVNKFAEIWELMGADLMLVAAVKLHEFETNNLYNSEEKKAFMRGLSAFTFFEDCYKEREAKRLKQEAEDALRESSQAQ